MKRKILKKLIAALCAVTMSMSVVTSAGAICYSNGNELSNTETKFISDLNNKIFNLGQNVIEMKTIVSGLNNINIPNK